MQRNKKTNNTGRKTVPVKKAVGMVLAHDITEIRPRKFKGRAFKKGHIIRKGDIPYLRKLGKENLYLLKIKKDEMHEDDAAYAMARALAGRGVKLNGKPSEGKVNLVAGRDGLLKVNKNALLKFNILGEVMCATIHNNSVVKKGQVIAGTRAIPLVVKKSVVKKAVAICENGQRDKGQGTRDKKQGVIEVKEIRKPKAGIIITGNEVYYRRIKDAFAPIITKKIKNIKGKVIDVHYAPDDIDFISEKIEELMGAGADLIITTGGMSVDPDDVTRFAIRNLGVQELTYGSPVLPGAMFLVAYLQNSEVRRQKAENKKIRSSEDKNFSTSQPLNLSTSQYPEYIPILGIPACGMYSRITIFDLILPRVLAGERVGRRELAELAHGGLCLKCEKCRYPLCPFGKGS